jgi:hypothetical protein
MNVNETSNADDVIEDDREIPENGNAVDETTIDPGIQEQEENENELEEEEHHEDADQPDSTDVAPVDEDDDADSSVLTSDDNDQEHTGTVVRRRRDGDAFLGEPGSVSGNKGQYADDEGSIWDDDEYIGLIPMLCARCARLLKRFWSDQRSKHYVVVVNVILGVGIL